MFYRVAIILMLNEFTRWALLVPALKQLQSLQIVSSDTVGGMLLVLMLSDALIKGWSGWLLDRFPTRIVLAVASFSSGAILVAISYSLRQPEYLLPLAALMGCTLSPFWVAGLRAASSKPEAQRGHAMSLMYTAIFAGVGAGNIIWLFVLGRFPHMSVRWLAIASLIAWGLSLTIPRLSRVSDDEEISLLTAVKVVIRQVGETRRVMPALVAFTAIGPLLNLALLSYVTGPDVGFTFEQYSYALLAGGIVVLSFMSPIGRIVDRIGFDRVLVPGLLATAVLIPVITLNPPIWGLGILGLTVGIIYIAILAAWTAFLARYIPHENAGSGWAVISALEAVGMAFGGSFAYTFIGRFGLHSPFYLSGAILLGLALTCRGISQREHGSGGHKPSRA